MNNLILKSFLLSILTFFAPVGWIIFIVSLSTIIDTFFGIWRSLKQGGKFKSKVLRYGFVPKVLSYCGSILFVYCCDYFIVNDLIHLGIQIDYLTTKLLALGLIGIEIKSIDESFEAVKGYSLIGKVFKTILKLKNIKKKIQE